MSKLKGTVSHHEAEVAELRADRELAVEYLKAAMESLDDPNDRSAGLLALRTVAEAYGGLGAVAAEAGISRESLYRALDAGDVSHFAFSFRRNSVLHEDVVEGARIEHVLGPHFELTGRGMGKALGDGFRQRPEAARELAAEQRASTLGAAFLATGDSARAQDVFVKSGLRLCWNAVMPSRAAAVQALSPHAR